MDKLTVVIPTRNRWEKLNRTIDSIPNVDYIDIYVICDGDEDTYNKLLESNRNNIKVKLIPGHNGSVKCRNTAAKEVEDGLLYSTDDIIFEEQSIELAYKLFNENFPDDDGAVSFKQNTDTASAMGVALLGKKLLGRFPNNQFLYPEYFHFSCQELTRLCKILSKTKKIRIADDRVRIKHFHPTLFKDEMDQTHVDGRRFRARDRQISRERRDKGLIWGYNE